MRKLSYSTDTGITRTGEIGFSRSGAANPEMRRDLPLKLPPFVGVHMRLFGSVATTVRLYLPSDGSAKFALRGAPRHASE
jgi:hypothetical protein